MSRANVVFLIYFSIINNLIFTQSEKPWNIPPMGYINDRFFDKVVFPVLNVANVSGDGALQKIIASGVLIGPDRILTSYNPYRKLIYTADMVSKTVVCHVKGIPVNNTTGSKVDYDCLKIKCGRPIHPMDEHDLITGRWHGPDKQHSPLHDLMVIRLENPIETAPKNTTNSTGTGDNNLTYTNDNGTEFKSAMLYATKLAVDYERMGESIKFGALGLKTNDEKPRNSVKFSQLDIVHYDIHEGFLENCNSWLPKPWGHFICLRNEFTEGFGSGALLFSNDKLFGVGSFTLWRGNKSILVFTDVRPYNNLIRNTCTDFDLTLK